jgi:hypothetical protein
MTEPCSRDTHPVGLRRVKAQRKDVGKQSVRLKGHEGLKSPVQKIENRFFNYAPLLDAAGATVSALHGAVF